jgi:hypothetical protein
MMGQVTPTRGTPHVDPFAVCHQDPHILALQGFPKTPYRLRIVPGDQYGTVPSGIANFHQTCFAPMWQHPENDVVHMTEKISQAHRPTSLKARMIAKLSDQRLVVSMLVNPAF